MFVQRLPAMPPALVPQALEHVALINCCLEGSKSPFPLIAHLRTHLLPPPCRFAFWVRPTRPTTKRTLRPARCAARSALACATQATEGCMAAAVVVGAEQAAQAACPLHACSMHAGALHAHCLRACSAVPPAPAAQVSAVWAYQARYRVPLNKAVAGNWVLLEGVDATSECPAPPQPAPAPAGCAQRGPTRWSRQAAALGPASVCIRTQHPWALRRPCRPAHTPCFCHCITTG